MSFCDTPFAAPQDGCAIGGGQFVLEWADIFLGVRLSGISPDERHDLAAGAGDIDSVGAVGIALGDALLVSPKDRFVMRMRGFYV